MVAFLPAMVATEELALVYVKAPELFEVGAVSVKGTSPYCLVGMVKLVMVGVFFTVGN